VGKRNRYRELERLMTRILLGTALIFVFFLLSSARGWNLVRVITAIVATLASLLSLAWLFITGGVKVLAPAEGFIVETAMKAALPIP